MNYVIGLSSETLSALQGLGNFGWEKLVDFFPIVCKQVELSAIFNLVYFWVCIILVIIAAVLIILLNHNDATAPVILFATIIILSFIAVDGYKNFYLKKRNPQYYAIQEVKTMLIKNN